MAFTRRRGVERGVHVHVSALENMAASSSLRTAFVFGREASGLRVNELQLCTHTCEIATSAVQGSMSLPAAASFALARTFEEALARDGDVDSRPLGGDATSARAARLRPSHARLDVASPSAPHNGVGTRAAKGEQLAEGEQLAQGEELAEGADIAQGEQLAKGEQLDKGEELAQGEELASLLAVEHAIQR